MRFLIVCIFILFGSITAYSSSSAVLPAPLTERLEQAQQAVWMISNDKSNGTAFFVSPRHVVTNWHIIHDQNRASLSLQQEGNEQKLSIKRLVSVSVLHDLALLETGESSTSHLTVRKDIVSDKEDLFLPGYPHGVFKYTLKTGPLKEFKDDIFIRFSINRTDLLGNSGGPVLDANNRVVGVISGGKNNYTYMIKGSILREFIAGNIGLNCKGRTPRACIKKEIDHLQEQAKRGSQIAQYELAMMYLYGKGVKRNLSSAFEWAQRAAVQGYATAQYSLGRMYYYGLGVFMNLSLARKWHQRAAEQGLATAQYSLGEMYYYGQGGGLNLSSARKWHQRAAEQGLATAQYSLGRMYDKGEGVEQNPSLAWKWYRRAMEQGHAEAQHHLGMMYYTGEGVEKNLSLAWKWYRRAAELGFPQAQYDLGMMYYTGEGVEKNLSLAFEWYRRAAEQGLATAQYSLGRMYDKGEGVEQNPSLARKWYQRSVGQQLLTAIRSLPVQYTRKATPRLQRLPSVLYENCRKLFQKGE